MYLPHQAKESLKELGGQIRIARKRRLWTVAELSIKMSVSAPTVLALEKGKPTVSVGVLVSALWILGLESELLKLAYPDDTEGIKLVNAKLPKKVRTSKRKLDNDF